MNDPIAGPGPRPPARSAHLEMMGAVLAGDGLERLAEIAARHAGAPVAVIVPRLGVPVPAWAPYERYVSQRVAGRAGERPDGVTAEVPISSGDDVLGAVLLLGPGCEEAEEYLHVAAVAALTEVAVAEARHETEETLRGSFLEEVLRVDELDAADVLRRAHRLGCDLADGYAALCADPGERAPGRLVASIAQEHPGALAQVVDGRVYALLPGIPERARKVAGRLERSASVGVSSGYVDPADAGRALEEAELMLEVTLAGGTRDEDMHGATYRLLFRVLASHPEEVRRFYEDTVAPLVRYDAQYSTDLVGTLSTYLAENCSMKAAAQALYAHRHTVAYRLDRVKELSGLDPLATEDRERLSLGLKAYRIIEPRLPR